MPDTTVAIIILKISFGVIYSNDSFTPKIPLAKIAGILNKKENLAAVSLFIPKNNPAVIVVPDRDEPGIKATH